MSNTPDRDILFIINPTSGGGKKINWQEIIRDYFKQLSYHIHFFILSGTNDGSAICDSIKKIQPQKVVAVGGDGTVTLVARELLNFSIPLAILPAGSANGMATELKIPQNSKEALDLILNGTEQKCDLIRINEDQICIHLSDLGLNARIIKYYDKSAIHGIWGYARMLIKILIEGKPVNSHIVADNFDTKVAAYMIVIANATRYGTNAVINPKGVIDDGKFELVIVRKISVIEFLKMFISSKPFNPKKVEIFQTTKAKITTKRVTHFQIDGEYLGKINSVSAQIIPSAIKVMVPK